MTNKDNWDGIDTTEFEESTHHLIRMKQISVPSTEDAHEADLTSFLSQDLRYAETYGDLFVSNQKEVTDKSKELATKAGALELPSYLTNYMQNSFAAATAEEKESLFTMVVRMTKEGMDILNNGLMPAQVFQHEGIALRGNSEYPSYTVDQDLNEGKISYQVYRENEDEVMLTVKLDERLRDDFSYVKLKKDDRIISSLNFNNQNIAIFNQLKVGDYFLELLGKQKYAVKMALC